MPDRGTGLVGDTAGMLSLPLVKNGDGDVPRRPSASHTVDNTTNHKILLTKLVVGCVLVIGCALVSCYLFVVVYEHQHDHHRDDDAPLDDSYALSKPNAVHLALTGTATEMNVRFTTGAGVAASPHPGTPVVSYVESSKKGDQWTKSGTKDGVTTSYTAKDLCGAPATTNFVPPGSLHSVTLKGLKAGTSYDYKVGVTTGQGIVWGDGAKEFTTAPVRYPVRYIVYGEQGIATDAHELVTQLVAAHRNATLQAGAVHHVGGLAGAVGAGKTWDAWTTMVEPLVSELPLMIAVGHQEYDHGTSSKTTTDVSGATTSFRPVWGNFGAGSGGECGVPVSKRFTMPQDTTGTIHTNGVFWYSYDVGGVHTAVLSSEHSLDAKSGQHRWLVQDLTKAQQNKAVHWIVLEMHRPLYNSLARWDDNAVGLGMQNEFEPLLKRYGVDLVLSGHYRAYLRTCAGLFEGLCHNGGPMHITVGTAGETPSVTTPLFPQHWTAASRQHTVGYGTVTAVNATALRWEFVGKDAKTKRWSVLDHTWLTKK